MLLRPAVPRQRQAVVAAFTAGAIPLARVLDFLPRTALGVLRARVLLPEFAIGPQVHRPRVVNRRIAPLRVDHARHQSWWRVRQPQPERHHGLRICRDVRVFVTVPHRATETELHRRLSFIIGELLPQLLGAERHCLAIPTLLAAPAQHGRRLPLHLSQMLPRLVLHPHHEDRTRRIPLGLPRGNFCFLPGDLSCRILG